MIKFTGHYTLRRGLYKARLRWEVYTLITINETLIVINMFFDFCSSGANLELLSFYADGAAAAGLWGELYLRGDARLDLLGVADDAYLATLGVLEVAEGVDDHVEIVGVEVAKAFVDEEAADGEVVA